MGKQKILEHGSLQELEEEEEEDSPARLASDRVKFGPFPPRESPAQLCRRGGREARRKVQV